MAATNVIHIGSYVTPEDHERLQAAAKRDGVNVARWVRDAIRLKLEKGDQDARQAQG